MYRHLVPEAWSPAATRWAVLLMLVAITGCGGGTGRTLEDELKSTDADLVRRLVSDLSDVKGRPERFRRIRQPAETAAPVAPPQCRAEGPEAPLAERPPRREGGEGCKGPAR